MVQYKNLCAWGFEQEVFSISATPTNALSPEAEAVAAAAVSLLFSLVSCNRESHFRAMLIPSLPSTEEVSVDEEEGYKEDTAEGCKSSSKEIVSCDDDTDEHPDDEVDSSVISSVVVESIGTSLRIFRAS